MYWLMEKNCLKKMLSWMKWGIMVTGLMGKKMERGWGDSGREL